MVRLHRIRRVTIFVPLMACLTGMALALDNGDTWQRSLVTTLVYVAGAVLSLVLVTMRPERPRRHRAQASDASDYAS